jgi:type VI secretion system protein ImpL
VVGATLPVAAGEAGGSWAEQTSSRIDDALAMLYAGLVARRLVVLDRHQSADQKPLAYEFPREWRKLSPTLSQLLVELCRPNQLTVNPFLRGFYVTGARPVAGATDRARTEWAFLPRVFGEVILADETAFAVTRAGTRLDALRRVLLGATASLLLLLAIALTVSFVNNRRIASDVAHHRAALAAIPVDPREPAPVAALQQLDSLRVTTDSLGQWVRTGAPLRYRFGLFVGERLHPEARRLYFAELRARLYEQARSSLLQRLRTVGGAPRDGFEFDTTYGLLKAHLVTTSHPDSSTGAFLGPVLTRRWDAGRRIDESRMALAQRQFAFLGDELPRGNPYSDVVDVPAVQQSRTFLLQLPVADRIYQFIKTRADAVAAPVSFARAFPKLVGALKAPHEVPGAFTRDGRAVFEQALRNIDQYLATEPWVLGDNTAVVPDRALLADSLRARYRRDAAEQWRMVLATASVVPFGRDAAMTRLQALAGNQSAIVALLSLVARHTAGDSLFLEKEFQPVRVVATADSLSPGAPTSKEYLGALARLGADIDAVSKAKGAEQIGAAKTAEGSVTTARMAVTALGQQMQVDAEGSVDRRVQDLLMQPITFASSTLAGAGTGELNGAGAAFCAAFNRVAQKFPFSPSSRMDATVSDLNELIKPGSGKFWKFYEEKLASVIMRNADGTFIAQPGGAVPIRAEFTRFLTQVGQLADGLYSNGASDPRLDFTVSVNSFSKTNTQVSFGVDSHVQQFSVASASVGSGEFTWSLQSARQAQLRADFASGDLEVTENGPWALFRLFFTASAWSGRGSRTVVEWTVTPQGQPMPEPLRMQLSLPDAPNVLRKDLYGSGIRCVSRVAD